MGWLSNFWKKESAVLGPFRRSRGVAGATGGFFFAFVFVFKGPLNNLPGAIFSAATTFCISMWSYLQERSAQQWESQSIQIIRNGSDAREQLMQFLALDQNDPFLNELLSLLETSKIKINESDTLYDLLTRYYFLRQPHYLLSRSSKMTYARNMLFQFGAHFIEYLLLAGFGKVETINDEETGATSNYVVMSLSLFALWNALNGLRDDIQHQPSAETLLKFVKLQHQHYQQRLREINTGRDTVSLLGRV